MKPTLNLIALAAITSTSAFAAENTLTIYTYDSFAADWGPGPKIEQAFEAKCGCDVNFVALDDGVSILNRLRLEGGNSKADIVLGLDNNLMAEAKKTGLLAEHNVIRLTQCYQTVGVTRRLYRTITATSRLCTTKRNWLIRRKA